VVFYIFDANAIWSVPVKNRSKEKLLCAYQEIYDWLTHRGFKPLLHKLDNKTSKDVKAFVATEQTCIQYTPSNIDWLIDLIALILLIFSAVEFANQ
jgi:hypothetical protein